MQSFHDIFISLSSSLFREEDLKKEEEISIIATPNDFPWPLSGQFV